MQSFNKKNDILKIINDVKNKRKTSLEEISSFINKDKSVTSRILNGKYKLDLETFINICMILDLDPASILDKALNPNIKKIPLTEHNIQTLNEISDIIKAYKNYINLE